MKELKSQNNKSKNMLTFVKEDSNLIQGVTGKLLKLRSKKEKSFLETLTSNSFSPIHITECPRRILYRVLHPELVSAKNLFKEKEAKEEMANRWILSLNECIGIDVVKSNVMVSEGKSNLVGYIDAIIRFCDTYVVMNFQPVSHTDFVSIEQDGLMRRHTIENVLYLWMADLKNSLLVYEDMQTKEYKMFHIRMHKPIMESIKVKCMEMLHCISFGSMIKRPYDNQTSKECSKCEFSKNCWGKEMIDA